MDLSDPDSVPPKSSPPPQPARAPFRRLHNYPPGRENWPLFRDYSLSWNPNEPNGLPPPSVILDDYLMAQAMRSTLKGDERHDRWPVNFMSKGYPDWHLRGTGRTAKIWNNEQWEYAILGGTELHGQEVRDPEAKRDVSKRSVKPEEHSKHRARIQDDDSHTEDERQSRNRTKEAVRYRDNRGHAKASSGITEMSSASGTSSPAIASSSETPKNKKGGKGQKRKKPTLSLGHRRRVRPRTSRPRQSLSPSSSSPPLPIQPSNSPVGLSDREEELEDLAASIIYTLDAYIFPDADQEDEDREETPIRDQKQEKRWREESEQRERGVGRAIELGKEMQRRLEGLTPEEQMEVRKGPKLTGATPAWVKGMKEARIEELEKRARDLGQRTSPELVPSGTSRGRRPPMTSNHPSHPSTSLPPTSSPSLSFPHPASLTPSPPILDLPNLDKLQTDFLDLQHFSATYLPD